MEKQRIGNQNSTNRKFSEHIGRVFLVIIIFFIGLFLSTAHSFISRILIDLRLSGEPALSFLGSLLRFIYSFICMIFMVIVSMSYYTIITYYRLNWLLTALGASASLFIGWSVNRSQFLFWSFYNLLELDILTPFTGIYPTAGFISDFTQAAFNLFIGIFMSFATRLYYLLND